MSLCLEHGISLILPALTQPDWFYGLECVHSHIGCSMTSTLVSSSSPRVQALLAQEHCSNQAVPVCPHAPSRRCLTCLCMSTSPGKEEVCCIPAQRKYHNTRKSIKYTYIVLHTGAVHFRFTKACCPKTLRGIVPTEQESAHS